MNGLFMVRIANSLHNLSPFHPGDNFMKKPILLAIGVILTLLLLPVGPAFAGSASLSGTLTPGGATMPVVFISTPNCTGQGAAQVLYAQHKVTVDTTGVYDFSVSSPGGFASMYIMSASFNPANGFPACLAGDNSGNPVTLSLNLTAGTTYYVIPFDDTFAQAGGSYTLTISGPGSVALDGSGGCGINIPAGSVVGEAPAGAQVFYEPGSVASGVVLNPGTYWVVGQDASQTYYKVVLACQFVWVRKDTMGPSWQPPQNGAPLPTGIVQ
jgi:hypothetical protein